MVFGYPLGYVLGVGVISVILKIKSILWATFKQLKANFQEEEKIISSEVRYLYGWGGWIRTSGTRYQKPLPYHLATPQRSFFYKLSFFCASTKVCLALWLALHFCFLLN